MSDRMQTVWGHGARNSHAQVGPSDGGLYQLNNYGHPHGVDTKQKPNKVVTIPYARSDAMEVCCLSCMPCGPRIVSLALLAGGLWHARYAEVFEVLRVVMLYPPRFSHQFQELWDNVQHLILDELLEGAPVKLVQHQLEGPSTKSGRTQHQPEAMPLVNSQASLARAARPGSCNCCTW